MVWIKSLYSVLMLKVVNDGNYVDVYYGEVYKFLSPKYVSIDL